MAKLKNDSIGEADLAEFVANDSDFDLEMRVLAQLRANGFDCTHSGTYRDPVTDKIRQYDIRAYMNRDDRTLASAVECKNLRANNPLLISSVPRTLDEAFHSVLLGRTGAVRYRTAELVSRSSAYQVGGQVGKKTDQVGRDVNDDLQAARQDRAIRNWSSPSVGRADPNYSSLVLPLAFPHLGPTWRGAFSRGRS
jgi:hypothetical protein